MPLEKTEKLKSKNEVVSFAKEADISEIIKLQQENLLKNLTEEEQQKEGFVSLQNNKIELKDIINGEGVFVVEKQNDCIVGYLFSVKLDYAKKLEFFEPLIKNLENISYKGQKIDQYKYCILAQICVKKEYRWTGVVEKLFSTLKKELINENYDLAISEIAESNTRSIHKHIDEIGMKNIGDYIFNNENWVIVALDLNK